MSNYDAIYESAWTQENFLASDKSNEYVLTETDLKELEEAKNKIIKNKIHEKDINPVAFKLFNLKKIINNAALEIETGKGFFSIKEIPVQRYNITELRIIYIGICSHLGFLNPQDKFGKIIHDIVDDKKRWNAASGRTGSSEERLPFHNDSADIVGLLCLNTSKYGGQTCISSALSIHKELMLNANELFKELHQPYPHMNPTWDRNGINDVYKLPIFQLFNKQFSCRYVRVFIDIALKQHKYIKLTSRQIEALNMIEELSWSKRFCRKQIFKQGEIQFLNNHSIFHSREPYQDCCKSGKVRHLLRTWLTAYNGRSLSSDYEKIFRRYRRKQ